MLIVYIAIGVATGIVSSIFAVLSGAGALGLFAAYVFGGMVGTTVSCFWFLRTPRRHMVKGNPQRRVVKAVVTQRS